ncbi:hypothetical protein [Paraburkholderia hospita]|uniref:hypothetical protein n=1 Tax=Paraburkholderia hospita TaxID=169430 RepID=UPI001F216A2E|nr:hypothetical protein [Paraburkholderia hospita]
MKPGASAEPAHDAAEEASPVEESAMAAPSVEWDAARREEGMALASAGVDVVMHGCMYQEETGIAH